MIKELKLTTMKNLLIKLNILIGLVLLFSGCLKVFTDDDTVGKANYELKVIDHSGNNTIVKLLKLNTGEFILVGNDYSNINGFVCKIDKEFSLLWWNSIDMWIRDAIIADGDQIIIAGETLQISNGYNKPLIKKINKSGVIISEKRLMEDSLTWGSITSVVFTSDNSLLFGGYKNTTGQTFYSIAFIVKTDLDFNIITNGSNKWPVYIDNKYFQGDWDEVSALTEINNSENMEYIVSGTSIDGIPAYGNKIWFLRLNEVGDIQTKKTYSMDNDTGGKITRMIEMENQIVSLGEIYKNDTINTTSKWWILKIQKNNMDIISDIKKGIDGYVFQGTDIIKSDASNYVVIGFQWKEFPTGWLMKWENNSADDDLIISKNIGGVDSSFVSLKGIVQVEKDFIIAGNKSSISNGNFGKDSIFIMKTDENGNCNGCFN